MTIDTGPAVAIEASPIESLTNSMLALVVTALSAEAALRAGPSAVAVGSRAGSLGFLVLVLGAVLILVGLLGMVVGGLWAVLSLWGALTSRGPVVTITREGIRDTRVAAGLIPWRAVREVRVLKIRGRVPAGVVLEIDPAVEASLNLTGIARWMRSLSRFLGASRLRITITAQGLKVEVDQLLSLCLGHAQASRLHPDN